MFIYGTQTFEKAKERAKGAENRLALGSDSKMHLCMKIYVKPRVNVLFVQCVAPSGKTGNYKKAARSKGKNETYSQWLATQLLKPVSLHH